jgi:nitronate monooxygenase
MGTRFMLTQEAPIHQNIKDWFLKFSENETLLLLRSFQNTERVAKTPRTEKALEMEKNGATIGELQPLIAGAAGQRMMKEGIIDEGVMALGQCIGLIDSIPTVKEVIDTMIRDAEKIINERLVKLAGIS